MAAPDISDLQHRVAAYSDQKAYKTLFEYFYPSLYQFAITYLKTGEQADEAVSDVFLKIWKKRAGLARIKDLRLYLYKSTKNTALNYLRSQKKPVLAKEQYQIQLNSIYFDPEKLLLTAEMIARVQRAIRQLPPRCQLIFKLVKEDGLKYREVADLLDISLKTVENQMTIALFRIGSHIQFDIHNSLSSGR